MTIAECHRFVLRLEFVLFEPGRVIAIPTRQLVILSHDIDFHIIPLRRFDQQPLATLGPPSNYIQRLAYLL